MKFLIIAIFTIILNASTLDTILKDIDRYNDTFKEKSILVSGILGTNIPFYKAVNLLKIYIKELKKITDIQNSYLSHPHTAFVNLNFYEKDVISYLSAEGIMYEYAKRLPIIQEKEKFNYINNLVLKDIDPNLPLQIQNLTMQEFLEKVTYKIENIAKLEIELISKNENVILLRSFKYKKDIKKKLNDFANRYDLPFLRSLIGINKYEELNILNKKVKIKKRKCYEISPGIKVCETLDE